GDEQNATELSLEGFQYQTLTAKLDYLQHKLTEMDFAIKEDRRTTDQKLSQLGQVMGNNFTTLQNQLNNILNEQAAIANQKRMRKEIQTLVSKKDSNTVLSQQTACANHELMRKHIQRIVTKEDRALLRDYSDTTETKSPISSCKGVTGKHLIQPTANDEPFLALCEETSFGGGWLVVQYRFNGSVDFYRNGEAYQNGFGSVDGEFWLGLEHLHQITSARKHELLVELKDFNGNYVYARYSEFEIGSEEEKYELKKLGSYTGTAGDSL
ncbi:AGAP011239-PA, partial [Anopheles gambiae str. PEST]